MLDADHAQPLRRHGGAGLRTILPFIEAVDIAWSVVFLSSERARQLTGQVLSVDGGWDVSEGQYPE